MKANELRIGNWVLNKIPFKDEYRPDRIEVYHLMDIEGGNADLKPIPLTPEILEKAGFEKSGQYWYELPPPLNFGYSFANNKNTVAVGSNKTDTAHFYHIKYLHQLQNLYFALTGEELNIEL